MSSMERGHVRPCKVIVTIRDGQDLFGLYTFSAWKLLPSWCASYNSSSDSGFFISSSHLPSFNKCGRVCLTWTKYSVDYRSWPGQILVGFSLLSDKKFITASVMSCKHGWIQLLRQHRWESASCHLPFSCGSVLASFSGRFFPWTKDSLQQLWINIVPV